jgi:hypothetical protein
VTYDATASSTPTLTTVGTFLRDKLQAKCSIPSAGAADLTVYVTPSNGEWKADYTEFYDADLGTSSTFVSRFDYPSGGLDQTGIAEPVAAAGGHETDVQLDFVQSAPSPGWMVWHATTSTKNNAQTCHLSVQTVPETLSAVSG